MRALTRLAGAAAAVAVGLAVVPLAGAAPAAAGTVDVRLISFNDFHGNLEPPAGSSGRVTLPDGTTVDAGGAAFLATHLDALRAEQPNSVVLSTGDNLGASPLASALFHDEPTTALLNQLGVEASVVGNHEFDEGFQELRRMEKGGCHPTDGCQFRPDYPGSDFPYLGANVYFEHGSPAVAPYTISTSAGIPVGVIGVTLENLPSVVTPEAIKGLKFGDEVEAVDRASKQLDSLGVRTQVVLLHQGDNTEGGGPDDCKTVPGPATEIASKVTASVDVVFTGHSHQQYNCTVTDPAGNPRPLIQGASFGRLLSVVDLKVDKRSRDVVRSETVAHNEIVTRDVEPNAEAAALVEEAVTKAAPIANEPVGTIGADLLRAAAPSGESALGSVLADGQLAATQSNNAQIAVTNPGGVRTDLTYASSPAGEGDGVVTYGEAYAVQPFSNIMQTMTLTGAQLKAVLEQQWQPQPDGSVQVRILQISSTLHYTWSQSAPIGSKVSAITIAGEPVTDAGQYRVSVNNFLAAGGDGFSEFANGTDIAGGPVDLDAFTAYLAANPNLAPPAADRITVAP